MTWRWATEERLATSDDDTSPRAKVLPFKLPLGDIGAFRRLVQVIDEGVHSYFEVPTSAPVARARYRETTRAVHEAWERLPHVRRAVRALPVQERILAEQVVCRFYDLATRYFEEERLDDERTKAPAPVIDLAAARAARKGATP